MEKLSIYVAVLKREARQCCVLSIVLTLRQDVSEKLFRPLYALVSLLFTLLIFFLVMKISKFFF